MKVEILRRERLSSGWYKYRGAVDGVTHVQGKEVGVRLPASYVESVSAEQAEVEVRDALASEYERLSRGSGGVYAR